MSVLFRDGKASHGLFGWYIYDTPRDRTQYRVQSFLSGASRLMAGYYSDRDNMAYMDDYMRARSLDYGDIKYPYRTVGWSGGSDLGSGVTSVSRNISSLYSSGRRYNRKYQSDMRRAYWDGRRSR